ncbi:hypothetical protein N1851_033759 [Merluccius polli]|uniref:CCHC-type domain-containing protein n=1 Tax=Merluccius polli TaxID=89951 RepID=A0AA47NND2_MERPO|nr:hypothetical protein N1851_033759 [Merluccius polli]
MLTDLSTDTFINGLRCFIAICGTVRQINSVLDPGRTGPRHTGRLTEPELGPRRRQCTGGLAGPSGRAHAGTPQRTHGPAATGVALDPQRAPQAAGQECWRCGQLRHFRGECPLMEVGQVIRVVGPPAPSPGPGGTYSIPNLIRPGALIEAGGTGDTCAVLSGDARSSDTADGEGEPAGPSQEAPPPVFDSVEGGGACPAGGSMEHRVCWGDWVWVHTLGDGIRGVRSTRDSKRQRAWRLLLGDGQSIYVDF